MFATHGLVPGELDGLHQPALALSAPDVAGVPGDGLLTMEEILALKLDADWVVLSACNTGAGAGAGAEAASGLGRAFFYAGTRAILVTNWSVHSASARELVSDLFRRQTADPKLTRGEALRQATMALLDGPGFEGRDGKTLFSYAHPLFWAPYTIIGDGGGPRNRTAGGLRTLPNWRNLVVDYIAVMQRTVIITTLKRHKAELNKLGIVRRRCSAPRHVTKPHGNPTLTLP